MGRKPVEDRRHERLHSHNKKFVREPETPDSETTGELPCHRCGRPVVIAAFLVRLHSLGEPIVVECIRPCVRLVKGESDV